MNWFLYNRDLRHGRVNKILKLLPAKVLLSLSGAKNLPLEVVVRSFSSKSVFLKIY